MSKIFDHIVNVKKNKMAILDLKKRKLEFDNLYLKNTANLKISQETIPNIKFEKVSFEQYYKDIKSPQIINGAKIYTGVKTEQDARILYDQIKLPKRGTVGSAGYDFFITQDIVCGFGGIIYVPTGIKVKLPKGYFLGLYNRSSIITYEGFGLYSDSYIIDEDYYNNEKNEGHICPFMINKYKGINDHIWPNMDNNWQINIKQGTAVFQGIIQPYSITCDDSTTRVRTGGYGSTTSK